MTTNQCAICACSPPYKNCAGTNADGGCARIADLEAALAKTIENSAYWQRRSEEQAAPVAPSSRGFVEPCCGEYATCNRTCTSRGKWIAEQRYEQAERELPDEPISWWENDGSAAQLAIYKSDYDTLRDSAVALKVENESLRATCGLRQIQGYNEGKAAAKAALATANSRNRESAEAYAKLFLEKAFSDKQLATALDQRGTLYGFIKSDGSWQWTELGGHIVRLEKELATARAQERERCAKACEVNNALCEADEKYDNEEAIRIGEGTAWNKAVRSCVDSIRALTDEPNAAATPIEDYIASLPEDKRAIVQVEKNQAINALKAEVAFERQWKDQYYKQSELLIADKARLLAEVKRLKAQLAGEAPTSVENTTMRKVERLRRELAAAPEPATPNPNDGMFGMPAEHQEPPPRGCDPEFMAALERGDHLKPFDQEPATSPVSYGPERQDYPGGPIYRVGTSAGVGALATHKHTVDCYAHGWRYESATNAAAPQTSNASLTGADSPKTTAAPSKMLLTREQIEACRIHLKEVTEFLEGRYCQEAWNDLCDQALAAIELERKLKISELKNAASLANNLCPDHRDKQAGETCLACQIERFEAKAERLRGELAAAKKILSACREAMLIQGKNLMVTDWRGMVGAIDEMNPVAN